MEKREKTLFFEAISANKNTVFYEKDDKTKDMFSWYSVGKKHVFFMRKCDKQICFFNE